MANRLNVIGEVSQQVSVSEVLVIVRDVMANNRGVWAKLEVLVRDLAEENEQLYVITGPIFDGEPRRIGGAVGIPAKLFKVVYAPDRKMIRAFVADNRDDAEVREVDPQSLQEMCGIRLIPEVAAPPDNAIR